MKDVDAILKKALALPAKDREWLVERLIESLDELGPPLRRTDAELEELIRKRIEEIESGNATLLDARKALAESRAKLQKRSRG